MHHGGVKGSMARMNLCNASEAGKQLGARVICIVTVGHAGDSADDQNSKVPPCMALNVQIHRAQTATCCSPLGNDATALQKADSWRHRNQDAKAGKWHGR